MANSKNKPPDSLEDLQKNSWQLELLVTGFALAGMLSGYEEFGQWSSQILSDLAGTDSYGQAGEGMVHACTMAYLLTIANLFIHVVVRCVWIGAIGSRSVIGDTVYPRRKLAPRFADFLGRRSGSIDAYIRRLDNLASLIFAFTFLVIAIVISFVLFLVLLSLFIASIRGVESGSVLKIAARATAITYSLGAFLYFLDFLSGGLLKRSRWFSYIYFPIYRFFGWVTLARLYRPLYYNLLNGKQGRRVILFLIPYLLLFALFLSFQITPNGYVDPSLMGLNLNSANVLQRTSYADEQEHTDTRSRIIIPSQIIGERVLRVIIPLFADYDGFIEKSCPDLERQVAASITSRFLAPNIREQDLRPGGRQVDSSAVVLDRTLINCLTSPFLLYLDREEVSLSDVFLQDAPNTEKVELVKFIPLDSLSPGLHQLHFRRLVPPRGTQGGSVISSTLTVPFYYAPES